MLAALLAGQAPNEFDAAGAFRCAFRDDGQAYEVSTEGVSDFGKHPTGMSDAFFTEIARSRKTAVLTEGAMVAPIVVFNGERAMSLVDDRPDGTHVVTTIFRGTRHDVRGAAGKTAAYRAVQTRHVTMASGRGVVITFFGTCQPQAN